MEGGVPYAIDFMNPAPDADMNSVGQENFDWMVNAVAEMAVKKALSGDESGAGIALGIVSCGRAPAKKAARKSAPKASRGHEYLSRAQLLANVRASL